MTDSTAISAQGTGFEIETGTGAAKAITGIAPGYPTIVNSAAHGLSNGDVGAIAAIVGNIGALLNGQSLTVTFVTADTYALQVDTTGKTYTSGGTLTPVTYTDVANVKSFNGFDGAASEIDVTHLKSPAKEVRLGLQDFGKLSLELNPDFTDPGQNAMRAARAASAKKNFKVLYPNGLVASFACFVKSTPNQGGVDAVISGSMELRITGLVTLA